MLVFIDETGDMGFNFDRGSSANFVLTAVVFDSIPAADKAVSIIQDLRKDLKLASSYEFHFSGNSNNTRKAMLGKLAELDFTWYAFCLKKQHLWSTQFQEKGHLMDRASLYLCNNLKHKLSNSKITFDKNLDSGFYKKLQKKLRTEFNKNGESRIRKIVASESHKTDLLQVADYCSSIVSHYCTGSDYGNELYKYIKHQRGYLQSWPK